MSADFGTAFAFSWKYLFTAFHIINEPSPEWKIEGVYISDQTDPLKFLYEVKVIGKAENIDVAVLKCHEVHFFRLLLRCNLFKHRRPSYTKDGPIGGGKPWEALCDAPPSDGFSGGPVLDREGQVVGMLAGRSGDADKSFINGGFTTSEGLIHALASVHRGKQVLEVVGPKSGRRHDIILVQGTRKFHTAQEAGPRR
jgi:S1-C subfamily serine protease